jgi:nicotinate-nucleotide adenylyltransferase
MRLGIFGGSFDPVHLGHLGLARACHEQAALDEVWFMPTAVQPLKRGGPRATDAQRIEMLHLALDAEFSRPGAPCPCPHNPWRVCTLEIDRGGLSYTVDTLRQLYRELPEAKLFFMLGADAAGDVHHWKEPAQIFRMAAPLVVRRAGQPGSDIAALAQLCTADTQPLLAEMPAVDVSSSEIRRRLAVGETIDGLVPQAVALYIAEHGLYRPPT